MSHSYLSVSELETLSGLGKYDALPPGAIRSVRRPRDMGKIKGLPGDELLRDLATTYLTVQGRLWPELVKDGLLPSPDDAVAVAAMAEAFKKRHASGVTELPSKSVMSRFKNVAGSYNRYSDENSKPTSIIDQLTKGLGKAKEQSYFVPWEFVSADYAVTGLDKHRSGYTAAKLLMAEVPSCTRLYVDDFTRASRDELEWWKLAALLKQLKKNLIGASDNFDLLSPQGEVLVSVYGLLSRLFLKGLREKVRRGRDGAIARGTVAGRVPFGYLRVPAKDKDGNVIYKSNGKSVMVEAVDPKMSFWVVKVFEWYANDCLSYEAIADRLNRYKVDGSDFWRTGTISKLICQTKYIGIAVYNRTNYGYDSEQNRTITDVPRREWTVRGRRELTIVDRELWKKANKRRKRQFAVAPNTGRKMSRNERSATTLLSGTLFCECGRELTLSHSDKSYASFKCHPGEARVKGCKLSTNKSVSIIEAALLDYVGVLLGQESIDGLVRDANAALVELQAVMPVDDSAVLRDALAQLNKKIKRCVERSAKTDDESLVAEYDRQGKKFGKEAEAIKAQLSKSERQTKIVAAKPVTREVVVKHLADLRGLLGPAASKTDPTIIPRAAEAIRALLGPIVITQKARPDSSRHDWIAHFTPRVKELLPTGTPCDGVTIPRQSLKLDREPLGIRASRLIQPLLDQAKAAGKSPPSVNVISKILNMQYGLATRACNYLKTGKLKPARMPKPQAKKLKVIGPKNQPIYKRFAKEVARLADVEKLPVSEIAEKLNLTASAVGRAYHYANRDRHAEALEPGKAFKRPSPHKLRPADKQKVVKLKASGESEPNIAKLMNVSVKTIRRCLAAHRASNGG